MDSRKFSISCFRWIYMFWDVLNTICEFLDIVCLSVGRSVCMPPKFCGHCISRAKERKVTKFYIQLHLDKSWCWLDIGGYRPIGGAAMPHFPRIFRYLKYLTSLGLLYGNKENSNERILIKQESFCAHRTPGGATVVYFPRIQWYFWFYMPLDCLHRIKPNLVGKSFITSKYVHYMRVHIKRHCYTTTHFPRI